MTSTSRMILTENTISERWRLMENATSSRSTPTQTIFDPEPILLPIPKPDVFSPSCTNRSTSSYQPAKQYLAFISLNQTIMSTRCQIGFYRSADVFPRNAEKWDPYIQSPETLLYVHQDGHPEQVMEEIIEFLRRWNPKQSVLLGQKIDIEYLSARFLTFIIWNRQGMIDASQKHDLSLC